MAQKPAGPEDPWADSETPERVPLPVRPQPYDSPGVWVEREPAVQGVTGRDEITPATTSGRNRQCGDCGGHGNVPNIHARTCPRYAVTELLNGSAVAQAREARAAYDAWMAEPVPDDGDEAAPGWDERGATSHGQLAGTVANLLDAIDAQAGA